MMTKRHQIANGWQRKNNCGQLVLCEIGPTDFDEYADDTAYALSAGIPPTYRREGSYYVFDRRRDFVAAIECLDRKGFIP